MRHIQSNVSGRNPSAATDIEPEELIYEEQTARLLHKKPATYTAWLHEKGGPAGIKVGRGAAFLERHNMVAVPVIHRRTGGLRSAHPVHQTDPAAAIEATRHQHVERLRVAGVDRQLAEIIAGGLVAPLLETCEEPRTS